MQNKRIMIIDGNSLLHRAFYALPPLKTKEGIVTNAVYGFLNMYYRVKEEYSPTHIGIVFDKKGLTFRHKEYEAYKAGRAKMPDDLSTQFPILKEVLSYMNVNIVEIEGFEADDIAGTISCIGEREGFEVILVSGDKDYLQLVDENTKVVLTKKGISDTEIYSIEKVKEEYELTPAQLIDLKGLMGDSSDNIPGVPGIGPKTGIKLLKEYGSVENLYECLENLKSSLSKKLELYKNQAFMSKMLAKIITSVPLDIDLEHFKLKNEDTEKLLDLYEKLQFKTLLDKVDSDYTNESFKRENSDLESLDIVLIKTKRELENLLLTIKDEMYIKLSYDLQSGLKEVIGASIITDRMYYVDLVDSEIDKDFFFEQFKTVASSKEILKYGYDVKAEVVDFLQYGIELEGIDYDAMIGMYLIDPSLTSYSINSISREFLKKDLLEEKELLGSGKKKISFKEFDLQTRADFFIRELKTIKDTKADIEKLIKERNMGNLFYNIEIPLAKALGDMQFRGFKIDRAELERLGAELEKKINQIKLDIYSIAEEEFNINSPKQLSDILFLKIGLEPSKKTKTGFSTDAEVLEKLRSKHVIIEKILDYRQLSKLKSTYIDGLKAVVVKDTDRVHSNFNQTIATTGRISSTEPNLQNIPIRTEEGRKIRKLFIASSEDYKLVDADYSQIELRVLAHISKDEKLQEAFFDQEDIHTKTASEVFGVAVEDVTHTLRSRAKAVNFGIVYGISDYGLARDLNISRKEAKEYIEKYFDKYPKVKEYMDSIIEFGKKNGFVETILNRRRYIPELKSRNYNIRGFGERIAMNTPIQGSAADIIKVAMLEVYEILKKEKMKSKLILQIHDELIVEAHVDEIREVEKILRNTMENAVKLDVPLSVELETGNNWYETK